MAAEGQPEVSSLESAEDVVCVSNTDDFSAWIIGLDEPRFVVRDRRGRAIACFAHEEWDTEFYDALHDLGERQAAAHRARKEADRNAKRAECRGFHWIGQSLEGCEKCGRPAWDHDGYHTFPKDTSPFDCTTEGLVVDWSQSPPLFQHYATDLNTGKPFWELIEEAKA